MRKFATGALGMLLLFGCADPSGPPPPGFQYVSVSTGSEHTCGVAPDGAVFCWGAGESGALGDGRYHGSFTPVRVALEQSAVQVSAGGAHTCAVVAGGDIFCWGSNANGQLGLPAPVDRGLPVRVVVDQAFVTVSSGWEHTCALTTAGVAYCWGGNEHGQVGNGETATTFDPARVLGDIEFAGISAGAAHSCGVATDGRAYCWGLNEMGQLGNGTVASSAEPVAVAGDATYRMISAGLEHSCALVTDGTAHCWGGSMHGELGNGMLTQRRSAATTVPSPIIGRAGLHSISAGVHVTCAAGSRGNVFCWGRGGEGQLGIGLVGDNVFPQTVFDLATAFVDVSARGLTHTCALSDGGGVYCWGQGPRGQLGLGLASSDVPVRVQGSGRL